jgi:hypothetical protein
MQCWRFGIRPCKNRHAVVAIIDGNIKRAKINEGDCSLWRIENVLECLKFVALDDMLQLWGCHHSCKIDPSVFVIRAR